MYLNVILDIVELNFTQWILKQPDIILDQANQKETLIEYIIKIYYPTSIKIP